MTLGPAVLLIYGVLMLLGGLMGLRAGSRASLLAGTGSGVLLLVAWGVTRVHTASGLGIGALLTLALCATFLVRVRKTGKLMPAGMLLGISVVALVLLVVALLGV